MQFYYLAPENVKKISVQKKDRMKEHVVHLETVEISPLACCFEWEGEQAFEVGEELHLHFDLKDGLLSKKVAVLSVDKCEFLDEGYEHKAWILYCAQFDGELDPDFFKQVAGPPRICKSFSICKSLSK